MFRAMIPKTRRVQNSFCVFLAYIYKSKFGTRRFEAPVVSILVKYRLLQSLAVSLKTSPKTSPMLASIYINSNSLSWSVCKMRRRCQTLNSTAVAKPSRRSLTRLCRLDLPPILQFRRVLYSHSESVHEHCRRFLVTPRSRAWCSAMQILGKRYPAHMKS
jgi:hypothetical protein